MSDSTWFYLSFVGDDEGFLGAAYVEASDLAAAITRSHVLEINPGGEVLAVGPIRFGLIEQNVKPEQRERLLTLDELGPAVRA